MTAHRPGVTLPSPVDDSVGQGLPVSPDGAAFRGQSIELRPPPFVFAPWLVAGGVAAVVFLVTYGISRWQLGSWGWFDTVVTVEAFTIGLFLVLLRHLTRPQEVPPIAILDDGLSLPRNGWSRVAYFVPYEDLTSVDLRGKGIFRALCLTTRRRLFLIPHWSFFREEDMLAALAAARARLTTDGGRWWGEATPRSRAAVFARLARGPVVTVSALVVLMVVFLYERLTGADQDLLALIALGANAPTLVAQGQLHRLVAANFIHANWLHLYVAGLALLMWGLHLERLVGHSRLLVLMLLGALGGSLASTIAAEQALSLGASGAVFGLFGGLVFLVAWVGRSLPPTFRQPWWWWALALTLTATLPFAQPQIDMAAHLGGFVCGAATAFLMCPTRRAHTLLAPAGRPIRRVAAGLLGITIIAGGVTAQSAGEGKQQDRLVVAEDLVRRLSGEPKELRHVARQWATDPKTPPAQVTLAAKAASQALEGAPHDGESLHTLGRAQYRLGRLDQAIATQRRACVHQDNLQAMQQLAEFLRVRQQEKGILLKGNVAHDSITLSWETSAPEVDKGPAIRISLGHQFDHPVIVVADVMSRGNHAGLFVAVLKQNYRTDDDTLHHTWRSSFQWPQDVSFRITLIDGSGQGPEPHKPSFGFYPAENTKS